MLENFEVIEIKKVVTPKEAPLNIIIEPKRVRFVKAVIEALGYAPFAKYLINPKGKQFAVQVGKGNEGNTVKFSKAKEAQKTAIVYQNDVMINLVRGMMPEWDAETKYIVTGKYYKDEKAVIFNLADAVPYSRKMLAQNTSELTKEV